VSNNQTAFIPFFFNLITKTAFIPNRSLSENVLLAQEIVKDYHKDKGKLDAQSRWA
jgi:hypothetical protein